MSENNNIENGKAKQKRIYSVYIHITPNQKVYVGITGRSIKERWRNEGNGYKKNKHFYSAILKYGWNNIQHKVLFTNLTKTEACQKEIELISKYKSNEREYGYNSSIGGEINRGFKVSDDRKKQISETLKRKFASGELKIPQKKMSEEAKNKLRIINLGKKQSKESVEKRIEKIKGRPKPKGFKEDVRAREQSKVKNIIQYDLSGKVICVFPSIQEAGRVSNIPATKICQVCKGTRKSAGGYIWKYEDSNDEIIYEPQNKLVHQFDSNGNYIKTYNSLSEAARSLNKVIQNFTIGVRKGYAYGFYWVVGNSYDEIADYLNIILEKQYHIYQVDSLGKVVQKFKSCSDVEKKLGLKHSNISNCVRSKTEEGKLYKKCGDYYWVDITTDPDYEIDFKYKHRKKENRDGNQ